VVAFFNILQLSFKNYNNFILIMLINLIGGNCDYI
jgi:hypothetical protein